MQPKQYRLREGSFTEFRKKTLLRTIPIVTIGMIAGLTIAHFNSAHQPGDFSVLPIAVPISLMVVGMGVYRGLSRQKELYESYVLTLSGDSISREQKGTRRVHIYQQEVQSIIQLRSGGFIIKSKRAVDLIMVPPQIDDYEELEATLREIKPFSKNGWAAFCERYTVVITLCVVALMATVFLSTNPLIVTIGGVLLLCILIWSLYEGVRSKNLDKKTKRSLWWLAVVLIAVVVRIFSSTARGL